MFKNFCIFSIMNRKCEFNHIINKIKHNSYFSKVKWYLFIHFSIFSFIIFYTISRFTLTFFPFLLFVPTFIFIFFHLSFYYLLSPLSHLLITFIRQSIFFCCSTIIKTYCSNNKKLIFNVIVLLTSFKFLVLISAWGKSNSLIILCNSLYL